MANYTILGSKGGYVYSPRVEFIEEYIDCATNNLAQGNNIRAIYWPAGGVLMHVGIYVLTVEAGATVDIGDSNAVDQYIDAGSLATATYVHDSLAAPVGKASADYISVAATDGLLDSAQFVVFALLANMKVTKDTNCIAVTPVAV